MNTNRIVRNPHPTARIVGAALFGLASLGAQHAMAGDGKRYNGSECRDWSTTAAPSRASSMGAVYNTSKTKKAKVVCPVIHDVLGSAKLNSASVTVIDVNNDAASRAVKCRLMGTKRKNGKWLSNFSSVKSSANGDPSVLKFGALGTSKNHHYFVRCEIPRRDKDTNRASQIVSYTVVED